MPSEKNLQEEMDFNILSNYIHFQNDIFEKTQDFSLDEKENRVKELIDEEIDKMVDI